MFLTFNKRRIVIMLLSNLVLSVILLFFSFYSYSVAMNAFERGVTSWFQNMLINVGEVILNYLVAIVFLLPENVRDSLFGGLISYISAFIMTAPVTLLVFFLIRKFSKEFRKR